MSSHDERADPDAETRARRARAEERRRRGVTVEKLTSFDDVVPVAHGTVESRLATMTMLTRAAFALTGRPRIVQRRSEWPGEVFRIDEVASLEAVKSLEPEEP